MILSFIVWFVSVLVGSFIGTNIGWLICTKNYTWKEYKFFLEAWYMLLFHPIKMIKEIRE